MNRSTADEPLDILLVEDNPGDVRLTQEAFNSIQRDVRFHVARDGEEAVNYFQLRFPDHTDHYPDLMLLDLNLPRIDGFAVLQILHTELEEPPPPIIVLSSSDAEEDIARSYRNGCNAYLTKPDNMRTFTSLAQSIEEFWFDEAVLPPHESSAPE